MSAMELLSRINFFAIFCLITVIGVSSVADEEFKIVETNDGEIRGTRQTSVWKKIDYYSFKGIPYAEKPIGNLRFLPPKPVASWKPNILDASEFGNTCFQLNEFLPSAYPQGEDCLYLNIYVPANVESNEKLPVLFFIHGGGYAEGHGNENLYGPDFIMERQTILVTINYRLGILGFLSLDSPLYSGNMGLKDQLLALKWIHANIEHFNGDKNKITIFGQSAGGASTHLHMLSSESRKYFRSAIPMSGSALNYWAMTENNDHLPLAYQIASDLGKPTDRFDELVDTLVSAEPDKLLKYASLFNDMDRSISLRFTPVVERSDAKEPFLVQSVKEIYNEGDFSVDSMFTFTSVECLMMISKDMQAISNIDDLKGNFSIKLPFRALSLPPESAEYRQIMQEVRDFYFGENDINEELYGEYVDLISDINFAYFVDRSAKTHAARTKGKTFYTRFSVESKLNVFKRSASVELPGASHCDDLCYLFHCKMAQPFYEDVFNNEDDEQSKISIKTIEYMTELFTNFAKNDLRSKCQKCSNLGFSPIVNDEINFLDITNNGLKPGKNPNGESNRFWWDIEQRLEKYIGKAFASGREREEL